MARAVFKDQLSYNDITINLPILKLLAPSKQSRAKKTPSPQNLFKKNDIKFLPKRDRKDNPKYSSINYQIYP
ncbi:uncharacterized protein OCT59_021512 [Rhizophagus irregularis]|uniref:uncharacterized protein n=1 Tax=Rhizophagus irregularis TaxID=588596 RepID=UPI000CA97F7D|nr:hypothetical protein OCT59_021512 [Rhizophagus irregularis]GBC15979.1 hypothetical protein RIR_jg42170.t1 [Rhizophagus irregularis DAOM 181602=DAOM 197198]CAB4383140.1 unnamed protein product [Rhizophagus irregularis]CAB5391429.1 unnamed protein product [Rhizophagus irregularis]